MAQDITIRFRGDTRSLDRALKGVNRSLDRLERNAKQSRRALQGIEAAGNRVSGALRAAGAALVAFGTGRAVGGILNATQTMEGFRTQLTTYLGSQALANAELERLSQLARSLPQDVNQLTEAFVIFNRFGLDTSNDSMRAFSNIAAANSKSITQLGEAVADALTGEFERLKEFGIKVSKENGQFTARIGEDQVAVAKTTKDLVDQLKALGEEGGRFGNVTIGPLTLAMSNFRGAIFEAAAALGSGGLGLAIADALNGFTDLLTTNDQMIDAIGDGLTKAFLYAKEAAIFLYNNIELLGKGLAIVIGISFARWAIGAATAMAAFTKSIAVGAVAALGFLAKGLIRTAALALRHPLIGGIALVIGGIEYFTGALSKLAEKMGLIGDESVMSDLVDQAKELGDNITGPIVNGIEDFSNISDRVNSQFDDIKIRSSEITQQLSEQEVHQANIAREAEQAAAAEESRANQVQQIINDKYEELRVSGLTTEEQRLYNLEKEIEKKIGKDITDAEREKLRILIQQTKEQEKIAKFNETVKGISKGLAGVTLVELNDRLVELDEAQRRVTNNLVKFYEQADQKIYNSRADLIAESLLLNQQYENERYRITKEFADKRLKIQEDAIRRELETYNGAIAQRLSGEQQATLQTIGNNERQQKIVNNRIEFEKKSEAEKWQWALGQAGSAFEELGRYNKKAFEASKALRIAEAIMNTYQAATLALATYPPPFGFIGAAVAVAAGLANVATIRSQQYTGRQLGGAVSMGDSYLVGETGPEIFTPGASGRIDRIEGSQAPVDITFNINAVDAASVDELLIQRKGTIQQVISDAMLERGQRSRF